MCRADTGGCSFGCSGAGASVQAGVRGAAVCGLVTMAAGVPRRAGAGVVIDAVNAGGAVCTGTPGALVDVDLAAQPCEA